MPFEEREEISGLLTASLAEATYRNYAGKAKEFLSFCGFSIMGQQAVSR